MAIPDSVRQDDDYSEIDRYQGQATPKQSTQLPGVDSLPDGASNFEIVSAGLRTAKTKEGDKKIFAVVLRVISGPSAGHVCERATWFNGVESLDFLAGDLLTLGVPADEWLASPSFGRHLHLDAPNLLKGLRFVGTKKTNAQGYANLYINARLFEQKAAPASAPVRPSAVANAHADFEIPF